MLKEERFDHILKTLKSRRKILYETIAKDLKISEDTVRRDIDLLNKRGLLVKVRGGAISTASNPLSFQDRKALHVKGKDIIALKAQQLVKKARNIFMDGGTTMLALASGFPVDSKMRVITNNVALVSVLANFANIEIVVLGGAYNRVTRTNVGVLTCQEAANYQADLYLMGICSIDSRAGVTAAVAEDGEVKKAFMKSSLKTVVLCNREKLETTDFFKVCDIGAIDTLVTDLKSDDKLLDPYRKVDLEIL
jgi:DeoR/GlpR family transcriptional regulator of sugar metabolism